MVKYIAIKGDEIHKGTAVELEKELGILAATIRQACYKGHTLREGYQVHKAEDAPVKEIHHNWTMDPEPWIELAGAIANIIITDYQRNPSDYNRKILESSYFQAITLGAIDPSSVKANEDSVFNDFSIDKLEDAMLDLGLTVSDIARLSGLNTSTITKYLTGYFTPREKTIFKLERAVGRNLRK